MELTPRMRALLDAGVRVVAREGLRGLTHRAVDREAGLPEGSCSAYLRTRLALLTALAQYVASRFNDDTLELTERLAAHVDENGPDGEYAVQETVSMFVDWLEHPEMLQTRLELALEGQRQPELAAVTMSWGNQLVEIVESLLRIKGHPDAEERAATLVASMEGVLLRAVREDDGHRRAYLERSLQMLMGALALGVPTS
jgi:DNA-binding transcriptional regulator YbjK